MNDLLPIALALLPVVAFLALLRGADTFRLVPLRLTLRSVVAGGVAAALAAIANRVVADGLLVSLDDMTRYVAPVIEEAIKAAWVVWLLRSNRCGFQVDTAIHAFAVGAGFALVENVYYLWHVTDATVVLWIVRGFGTAIMHGSATAIFGILAKELADLHRNRGLWVVLLPLPAAIGLHSAFNHFYLPALANTLLLLVAFPLLVLAVLARSERATRKWLHTGFDSDAEMLQMLLEGELPGSPVGNYLDSLRDRFAPDLVADMVAYLQVGLELSLQAKGRMMAREAGIALRHDPEIAEKIAEYRWLEKRLGPAGRLVISPLVARTSHDLWQILALDEESRAVTR